MLCEIVAHLVHDQSDMNVVATEGKLKHLAEVVKVHGPDVVICSNRYFTMVKTMDQIIKRYPKLKFIVFENQGRTAFLYKMMPVKILLGEISSQNLMQAIRSTGQSSAE